MEITTQDTLDTDVRLPDAYGAKCAESRARLNFDRVPEEQDRSLDYQAEESEESASTSAWTFRAPIRTSEPKLPELLMLATTYGFRTVVLAALSSQSEGLTTSKVIILDDLDRPARVDWDRWHELLDKAESGILLPDEAIEYEKLEKVVQVLDAKEARVAAEGLDQLENQHDRVLASIRRVTDAVVAATRSS